VADLTDGATYQFSVVAENSIDASQYSDTVSIIAATVPETPAQPTVVTASSASITIEWDEPGSGGTAIKNYHVYEAVGSNPSSSDFAFLADTVLSL
jgi:hypothetical protein